MILSLSNDKFVTLNIFIIFIICTYGSVVYSVVCNIILDNV